MEKESNSEKIAPKTFLAGRNLIISLAVILIVGIAFGTYGFNELNPTGKIILLNNNNNKTDAGNKTNADSVSLDLFVMSQCPYGTQAEDTIMPVIESFGDKVDFKLYFLASETENGFVSLHGMAELQEDMRQNCIQENYSQKQLFDYLECVNSDISNVASNWKSCAEKVGINPSEVESCVNSEEGKQSFKENVALSKDLMVNASPTYYINDELYSEGRTAEQITRHLCSLTDAEVCSTLPEETPVNFFIVNDSTCSECDVSWIIPQIKSWFPELNVKEISFDSEEGKTVLEKFQVETLPFMYFDETLTKHYNFEDFKIYTAKNEELYALNFNGIKFFKRTEKPNHIDLFVMSQCPYGIKAETNLKQVAEVMPDLTYSFYFIASEDETTESGFSSLHGQVEVNEGIRQVCIQRNYPDKLLDYLECVNEDIKNVEGNWKACAIKNEIDVKTIESCYSTQGKELFKENISVASEYGVSGSPNFVFNGQIVLKPSQTFTYTPAEIQKIVCSYNSGLEGCDAELSGNSGTVPAGSC